MFGRRLLSISVALSLLLVVVTLFASCGPRITYADDPAADTPGYKLFTGKVDGFRTSFEYPETWRRVESGLTSADKTERWAAFLPDDYSDLYIRSKLTTVNGGDFTGANEWIEHVLAAESTYPDFQIISRGEAQIGLSRGEEAICSFKLRGINGLDYQPPSVLFVQPLVVAHDLAVDHNGRIYALSLLVDAEHYVNLKEGFEHLITTFRFLE